MAALTLISEGDPGTRTLELSPGSAKVDIFWDRQGHLTLNCAQVRYNSEVISSAMSRQLFRRGAIRDLGVGVLASRTFGADPKC